MRLVLAFLVAGGVACTRPTDDAHDADVVAHVKGWLSDLEADDDATAAKAVTALEALGPADAGAVPVLLTALSCPPEAANGVGADDHHHADAAPVHDHHDHDHGACNDHRVLAAARALGAIGAPAVSPLLTRLRTSGEPDRTFAGYALGRMAPSAAPTLLAALDDPDPRIRLAIVGAIRNMQPPPADAIGAIAGRLTDADPEVRMQAADTLGHFGAAAVPELVPAFEDAEPRVRASVASAFRAIGLPARDAAPTLRVHLGDASAPVRLNAAAALAAVGADDAASVAALAAALEDGDHTVRWGAAQALGRLGAKAQAARPALERARNDAHALVRTAAADALARLDAPPH